MTVILSGSRNVKYKRVICGAYLQEAHTLPDFCRRLSLSSPVPECSASSCRSAAILVCIQRMEPVLSSGKSLKKCFCSTRTPDLYYCVWFLPVLLRLLNLLVPSFLAKLHQEFCLPCSYVLISHTVAVLGTP